MKTTWMLLLAVCLFCGCARNTIETRKQERYSAYTGLPEEMRSLVDQGQVKVGMSMDAVYIAWGQPDQVYSAENANGAITTWLYHNTKLESYHYWTYRSVRGRYTAYSEPYLEHDYYVRPYVSAEVVFQDGVVQECRTLPYPVY
jgi:hypothetical protein